LGKSYFKQNIFPLIFFIFAVPFWEFLNPLLLNLTTVAVTYLLDFTPIIAFMDGNRIELPYGILEIAGGCSGLRYFEIGLALSVFAVYSERLSLKLKFLVLIIAMLLGIVTNWLRVLSLIYVGYESKMTSSLMNDHEIHGLIVFMLVIAPLLYFINWLSAKYSLTKVTATEQTPLKQNNTLINKNQLFNIIIFICCITSITSLTNINQGIEQNIQPKNLLNKKEYPLLNSDGNYTQTVKPFKNNSKCSLIIRNYYFNGIGKNALPFNGIFNQANYSLASQDQKLIPNTTNGHKVNYLYLVKKNTSTNAELYYWYEYNNIKLTNRYVAKLTEIVFLFNDQAEISIYAVTCPETNN